MARIVLIGGTSHAGKSTLARGIAARLGVEARSTDKMGRHPGRPWPTPAWDVPPHVVQHYLTLSDVELLESNLAHYRAMWPSIVALLAERADTGLVLEGSGVWPESVATLAQDDVAAVWLTASDAFLTARIETESGYANADAQSRRLIERFIARTLLYNARMMDAVRRLSLPWVDVERASGSLVDDVMRIAGA